MDATLSIFRYSIPLTSAYVLSFGQVRSFETFYVVFRAEGRFGAGEVTPLPGYSSETPESVARELTDLAQELGRGRPIRDMVNGMAPRSPFAGSGVACAFETWLSGPKAAFYSPLPLVPLAAFCAGQTPKEAASRARDLVGQGYSRLKVKVGEGPDEDLARVRSVAAGLPEGVKVRLDANQGYTFDQALAVCQDLEGMSAVELLEQPFAPDRWREHENLARKTGLPIMLDESIWNEDDVRRASDCGAGLVKFKLCKHLGLEGSRRMIGLAHELGLGVVYGNGVQTALGNHLEAGLFNDAGLVLASESNGFLKTQDSPVGHRIKVRRGMLDDGGLYDLEAAFEKGALLAKADFSHTP